MRLKILILWVLITPFCLFAQVESFQFSNLSVRDGLSQNTVIRILQDSKNYMWFCTRDGLNRYDGTSFKVYRFSLSNENSISSSDVTSISENKDGTFWIGTHNGLIILILKKISLFVIFIPKQTKILPQVQPLNFY